MKSTRHEAYDAIVVGTGPGGATVAREIPMATGVHMAEEGYVMTDMIVPRSPYKLFAAQVFRLARHFTN